MAHTRVVIVTPVYYKEAPRLAERVFAQLRFFKHALREYQWQVVIANNGPRKDALDVAQRLAAQHPRVRWTDVDQPGRGWSLVKTWMEADADVLLYMDAELATNLGALPIMIQMLSSGAADVVTGSRYVAGSKSKRTFHRWLLSKGYNMLLQLLLGLSVRDSQCGFKGLTKEAAQRILPLTRDRKFFFDSEMLYVGQRLGLRIREIPVEWEEQNETSVHIFWVAVDYVRSIVRLLLQRFPPAHKKP